MALYLATDEPVAPIEWREGESVVVVQGLGEYDDVVRRQFTKPAVCYLGAYTGCSCGFTYGQFIPSTPGQERDEKLGRRSVEELRRILTERVANGRIVELFACWEGDQAMPPLERLEVAPSHFAGDTFALPEKVFYRVRDAAQQRVEADEAG